MRQGATTIEDRLCALLSPRLAQALRERTRLGILKYGQRLDDHHQPEKAKAVHLVQELLDGAQYAEWMGRSGTARRLIVEAELAAAEYGLTTRDIVEGGKT